jgi:predicted Zn-dependent peptidase
MKNTTIFFGPEDKQLVLDNGLVVLLKKSPELPVVSVQVWVKTGSIYETEQTNGISHFLEHLVFKGTEKYLVNQISKKIESYGGIINAGTSKEYTVYFVDIPKEGIEDAFDVISQLVFHATFPEDELEKERLVVIEEIKRYEDNPGNVLYENFNNKLFTLSSYKWRILGKEENIRTLPRQEIINYYKTHYHPKNMVLSICGDFDNNIYELIKKYFDVKISTDYITTNILLDEEPKGSIFEVKKHKVQHTYFLSGFLGPKINDKHQYTGDVLSIILGEGISSRLYEILREEKHLVYEIGSGFYTQLGPSIFYISGVCERKNLEKVVDEINNILTDLRTNGPTDKELEKAKQILLTRWYFNNETVHSKSATAAWWFLFKSLEELNSYIDNINKINKEDIKEFLTIYGQKLVTFALEPE